MKVIGAVTIGIPKNQIVNTVRRFDELNEIAFCDKRRK